MLLEDKIIVVTGSTRGIGKGIALKIAENGGTPVICGTNKNLLENALPEEFSRRGFDNLLFLKCDVTKKEDVEAVMKASADKYGRIDGVCANAGITDMCPFEEMTPDRFDKMISVNLRGVYLTDWYALPYLKESQGKIVNIGSDCSLEGWEYLSSYSAAKFGVRGLTQALAKELGAYGITVNCLCPGIIDTDMWVTTDELLGNINGREKGESWREMTSALPLGRGGLPGEIGDGAVFLFSRLSDYITGCALPVGGGSSLT